MADTSPSSECVMPSFMEARYMCLHTYSSLYLLKTLTDVYHFYALIFELTQAAVMLLRYEEIRDLRN